MPSSPKPVTLALISDTHGGHHDVGPLPPADILVHCGDCTAHGTIYDLRDFLLWFAAQPHEHKVFVAGNHDAVCETSPAQVREMLDEEFPSIHYLQDSGETLMGLRFWGSPVTPTFLNWYFSRDRGPAIRAHWDKIPTGEVDVLVTHGPAIGYLDLSRNIDPATGRMFADHLGCADLRDAVKRVKPQVHAFGHIHGSGGRLTGIMQGDEMVTVAVNASLMDESYDLTHKPQVMTVTPRTLQ